jgi:hypothetical protein
MKFLWEKIRGYFNELYCSRAWQKITPGGTLDRAGRKLIRAKRWNDAEKYYEHALAKHPGKVLFLERLAFLKRKTTKNGETKIILHELARKYPGVNRFSTYIQKHDYYNEEVQTALFGDIPYFSSEYFACINQNAGITLMNRSLLNTDLENKYVHYSNGIRKTIGVPTVHDKTVYLIGSSHVRGVICENAHTIASFLQSLHNDSPDKQIRIVNFGVSQQRLHNALLIMLNTNFQQHDTVVYFHHNYAYSENTEDFRFYSAMMEVCARKRISFHVALVSPPFLIKQPSTREQLEAVS